MSFDVHARTVHSSRVTGTMNRVKIDLGKHDQNHFIDPEECLRGRRGKAVAH